MLMLEIACPTVAVILKIHGIFTIRNWFNNLKDDFVIYVQLITIIITCSLFITLVYLDGFMPSSIG